MHLRQLVRLEFNSGIARTILGLYYKPDRYYRIPWGPLKGMEAYYRRDVNYHAILGLWELEAFALLTQLLKIFDLDRQPVVIADIGANMGFYSMFFSSNLHPCSRIFAFEPSPLITDVLRRNMDRNALGNVAIVERAISDKTGTVEFFVGDHHHTSSLLRGYAQPHGNGTVVRVSSTTIDAFFGDKTGPGYPDIIKLDIEGGGVWALKGINGCIQSKRPFILIESHTSAEDMAISDVLVRHDYEALRVGDKQWVLNKDKDYKDPKGVFGTMLLIPAEKKSICLNGMALVDPKPLV